MIFQAKHKSVESFEAFTSNDTLMIKKTQNYEKVFGNSKYTIWIPKPINDYYPIGNYISLNKKAPTEMATLVKNNSGLESNDKPIKYEIVSITNKNDMTTDYLIVDVSWMSKLKHVIKYCI